MADPVVLVTGATDGIGRETAIELPRRFYALSARMAGVAELPG